MRFRNFPTVKCPHCKTWLCNSANGNLKTEIITDSEVITPKEVDAEIIIRCHKCKAYIAIKNKKTEQSMKKSTA